MSFLTAYFYDKIMADTEQACLRKWRKELLNGISGKILEIGAGTGANLEFYPRENISLTVSEPDHAMRNQLTSKINSFGLQSSAVLDCIVTENPAEDLQFEEETFDFVVASLVCCSVKNLEDALIEIKRVLKVGGGLVFMEHVAANTGSNRRRWQNMVNPLWRKLAGNCHLNRETEAAIQAAGFEFKWIHRERMRKAMPLVRPSIRGIATKQ